MPKKIDSLMIYNIAKSYYIDGLEQADIAKRIGVSRSQVSRFLNKARSMGIIQYKLVYPIEMEYDDLAMQLKEHLNIPNIKIVPVDEDTSKKNEEHITTALAVYAAKYLPDRIKDAKVIGVGWGNSVYQTILQMDHHDFPAKQTFVPLIGSIGQQSPSYQINTIIDRVSEKFKGNGIFISGSTYHDKTRYGKLDKHKTETIIEYWNQVDLAIIGLGKMLDKQTDYLKDEMSESMYNELLNANITGDILGQFYHEDGSIYKLNDQYHVMGFHVEKLKKVKNVICICGGKEKISSIIAGARAGYFKTLITDSSTAQQILEKVINK